MCATLMTTSRAFVVLQAAMLLYGLLVVAGPVVPDARQQKVAKEFREGPANTFMLGERTANGELDPNNQAWIVDALPAPALQDEEIREVGQFEQHYRPMMGYVKRDLDQFGGFDTLAGIGLGKRSSY